MAWFDEFNLPGATIDGYFGFIQADGPDDNDYPDVVLANGWVTFTATTDAARIDGAWLGIEPVTAQIFEGQIVISEEDPRPVRLLATDAPIGVADWAWKASFNVPGFRLNELTFRALRDTTVNLTADLIPIKSQPYQIIEGASIVDTEVDTANERMRFEMSDGTFTKWVPIPNGEKGDPGPKGDEGEPGLPGVAASLSMGAVVTGANADAWMTGTPTDRLLNLTLPRGPKGDKGDPGGDVVYRGIIPDGTDINTITAPGFYTVPTVAVASTLVNWPTNRGGTLTVSANTGSGAASQDVIAHVSATAAIERYTRTKLTAATTSWGPWSNAEWIKGRIPIGTDVDTFRTIGAWVVVSASDATGLPGSGQGLLEVVFITSAGISMQRFTERVANDSVQVWHRFTLLSGGWAGVEWSKIGGSGGGGGDVVYRGSIPDGSDVDAIREAGVYSVPTATVANSLVNWPTNRAGILTVWTNTDTSATSQEVVAMVSAGSPVERYSRATISSLNTAWSSWTNGEFMKGTLVGPVNLDTFRSPGAWAVAAISGIENLPVASPGVLENIVFSGAGVAVQRYTARVSATDSQVYTRTTLLTGGWAGIPWKLLGGGGGAGSSRVTDVQASDHASRVELAASRRGGSIGTGGKPVFMWRFDHWLVAFRDKILPILQEFDLPATLNVNYDNIDNPQNGGGSITWEDVQDWNQYSGIEIANHGATHTNASTMESIYHEVVEGRRLLEAAMPRVAVETWQEHGSAYLVASDLDGDIGLDLGREPRNFFESYAGRLVMAEHAVVEGKNGSFYPPLTGKPQIGQSHYSMDRQTAAEAIATIQYAQRVGRGLTGYTHPGLMDQVNVGGSLYPATYNEDGSVDFQGEDAASTHYATEAEFRDAMATAGNIVHMPVKDFRAVCEWLATERDADRLMVMTAAGGGFADKRSNHRENLFKGLSWSGTGWTVTGTGLTWQAVSTGAATAMSQGMLLYTRYGWAMGAAHELLVWAKASTATTLTLGMEQAGDPAAWSTQKVHDVPGDGVLRPYRLNLTLPRDRSITQMTARVGGPSLTIEGEPLLAAI